MLLLFLALVALASAYPSGAKITNLPGYNGPPLSMYSGYVGVGGTRRLFYWLVEAQNKDPNAPLIFWYQGGPGCSGLAGLMTENGPLNPNRQGGLDYRPVSWTNFASVVFLEQPAFVGYSYSDDPMDHYCDDDKAARDNLAFVNGWLEQYPSYKGRQTWFMGESYGGVYVPSLTALALADRSSQIYKQLAGIATGNPVFNCGASTVATQMSLYYWHGLVSWSDYGPFVANGCLQRDSSTCDSLFSDAQNKIGVIDQELMLQRANGITNNNNVRINNNNNKRYQNLPNLDPDDLYQDFCTGNASLFVVQDIPDNCSPNGDLTTNYLRRRDVHRALHTSGPFGIYTEKWSICSSKIAYVPQGKPMAPLYRNFQTQKPGFRVLVYSGDVDIATVPFGVTHQCLSYVSTNITNAWQPYFVNGNTAGYYEQTPYYTHATIKGAGHEAPQYQPVSAYQMVYRFVKNGHLSDTSTTSKKNVVPPSSRITRQGQQLRMMMRKNKISPPW